MVDEGADDEVAVPAEVGRDGRRERAVGLREIGVDGAVLVVGELGREVVEQEREPRDPERGDLLELRQEDCPVLG